MERLTQRLRTGEVLMASENEEKYTEQEWISVLQDRLAAYEDTGLTPERCAEFARADAEGRYIVMRDAAQEGVALLRELAEADKDGRVVVLPCKVDDTVYRIVRDADPHITRDEVRNMYFADDMTLCVELISGRIILPEKFGKTVFLTREEAEKALEAMKK